MSKYQGRRLNWNHSLDRCIVTARFKRGKKELELSFLQTIVLLCFKWATGGTAQQHLEQSSSSAEAFAENSSDNEKKRESGYEKLRCDEILSLTGIEQGELSRTLQSLACGMIGTRVLLKEPKGKDVSRPFPPFIYI